MWMARRRRVARKFGAVKAKDHPPVAGDLHRPETVQIALEWMQPVAWTTEILGRIGRIQIGQDDPELRYYLRGHAPVIPFFVEAPESFMAEALDHPS